MIERKLANESDQLVVYVQPMRRRHVRSVLRIEAQVYPRPWSAALFQSELALRETRAYYVARVDHQLVGYGGLMMTLDIVIMVGSLCWLFWRAAQDDMREEERERARHAAATTT